MSISQLYRPCWNSQFRAFRADWRTPVSPGRAMLPRRRLLSASRNLHHPQS